MAQKPVIAGSVYFIDGVARLKMHMSYDGEPLLGQFPTITIIRDSDGYALDFTTDTFIEIVDPADLDQSKFKLQMNELGLGSYWWEFDPLLYGQNIEHVYTSIFINDHPTYNASTHDEFLMTNRFDNPRFGLLDRPKQVALNEETLIAYQARPGQHDVLLDIYDPFDNLLVASATMIELENTGIYRYKHTFTLDGEYVILVNEETQGSTDSMIIVAGRESDRLKKIEEMLSDLLQNPPTVNPC